MTTKTKLIAILPVVDDPGGSLPAIVVPRLMRIQDAAKYLSATTWQVETLLREKVIPSFVLGKRRVVDRLELDCYVERRNALAKAQCPATEKEKPSSHWKSEVRFLHLECATSCCRVCAVPQNQPLDE